MSARHKAGYIEEFYRHGSPSLDTGSVVGFAAVSEVEARAGTRDLEVSDGALGVDGGKSTSTTLDYHRLGARIEAVGSE